MQDTFRNDENNVNKDDHVTSDAITPPIRMDTLPIAPQEGEVTADVVNQEENVSDMSVARPEEQSINEADKLPGYVPMVPIGLEDPTSVTPAEVEVACSVADCGFVTTSKVPINGELAYEMQLVRLQMEELQLHTIGVHGVEVDGHESFVGDDADITAATLAELDVATGKTAPKGWTKSSSRSTKSKHRKKSKRF